VGGGVGAEGSPAHGQRRRGALMRRSRSPIGPRGHGRLHSSVTDLARWVSPGRVPPRDGPGGGRPTIDPTPHADAGHAVSSHRPPRKRRRAAEANGRVRFRTRRRRAGSPTSSPTPAVCRDSARRCAGCRSMASASWRSRTGRTRFGPCGVRSF
jgi:hypothetical protein